MLLMIMKIKEDGKQTGGNEGKESKESGGTRMDDKHPPEMTLVKFLHYMAWQKVQAAAKKARGF